MSHFFKKVFPQKAANQRRFSVALYCPDTHIAYNGRTPDEKGVGGGLTARVRALKALAAQGHQVTAYVNCDREGEYDGVIYRHYQRAKKIKSDIFIATTSGGELSLLSLEQVKVKTQLRIVWVQGIPKPKGLEIARPDFVYVPSNFIRVIAKRDWSVEPSRLFVTYNALEETLFCPEPADALERDPFALVYLGYPGKGLDNALAVLNKLRDRDPRFHLSVYGDYSLWGQKQALEKSQEGLHLHGTIPQKVLAKRLFRYTFMLALQDFEEPFGIALIEAKRAGVIPIASPVGAFPETVRHGVDGVLIEGDPKSDVTHERAARAIWELSRASETVREMRQMAMPVPWTWEKIAQVWTHHWQYVLEGSTDVSTSTRRCPLCGDFLLSYPDGWRCERCGYFVPAWPAPWESRERLRLCGRTMGEAENLR